MKRYRSGKAEPFRKSGGTAGYHRNQHAGGVRTYMHKLILLLCSLIVGCTILVAPAYAQPGGGKTTETTPKPPPPPAKTTTSTKPATTSPKVTTTPKTGTSRGQAASIEGKWWTSGNDFGASEIIFTQNGSMVTGEIHYADGRTGTLTGTMVGKRLQNSWTNSAGESGSGWLELSWNNFLGGPWKNQKVRDGSWTMMRIEGKWCFGGSRERIRTVTHNARGEVLSVTEDGTRSDGRLDGPWMYLDSGDGMTIKGEMDFRANRMNWSSGFYWSWCGRN